MSKVNLLDFNQQDLKNFFIEIGEKPYRAQQILKWIHQYGVIDFDQMQNIGKQLRERLTEIAEIRAPEIAYEKWSRDGTCKWIMRLSCGNAVETVFIPQD